MTTNFQGLSAPLAVLALLGAGALTALLIAGAGFFALRHQRRWALRLAALALAVPLAYAALLLGLAAASRETVAAAGTEKHFCEIDCHLAYAVVGVESAGELASAGAAGRFWIVALRTRFDETTIGPRRGDGLLYPNPRTVTLVDGEGRELPLSTAGTRALAGARGEQPPLTQALRPGESYVTRLVFDAPADASGLRLWIRESDWPTRLLLGHENSPGHGRSYLALPAPPQGVEALSRVIEPSH